MPAGDQADREATDAKGRDLQEAAEPKEIAEFRQAVGPRGHRVFFGALDPGKLGFAERSIRKLPAARAMLPEGDFSDWADELNAEAKEDPMEQTDPKRHPTSLRGSS